MWLTSGMLGRVIKFLVVACKYSAEAKYRKGMALAMPITAKPKVYTSLPQARVEPAGRNDGIAFLGRGKTGGYIHECVPWLSLHPLGCTKESNSVVAAAPSLQPAAAR